MHKLLGLPKDARVVEVRPAFGRRQGFEVFIESPDLPDVPEGEEVPELFCEVCDFGAKLGLVKLEIQK